MSDLLQRIENSIRSRKLISRGEKILVTVSGGIDSMVLLHALKLLSVKHKWKITVAHFNHQLRGRTSDADEKLVRRAAAKMKSPIFVESADVKSFAKKSKLSIEMAARKLRHEFFARTARKQKIKTVALAHHADDQVELFFLRLLRGAGSEGLAGMKWQSPSPADKTISLIRPLLGFSKSELTKFARDSKIQFRNDATNFSSDFFRNRIRNELLPLLKKNYQPALSKTVLRLMEIVGAESYFISKAATLAKNFQNQPVAVQRRILQRRLVEQNLLPDFDLIEALRKSPGRFISVGNKISIVRDVSGKIILRAEQTSKFNANELAVKLDGAGKVDFGYAKFAWKFLNGSQGRSPHRRQTESFDADKIGGRIILRHWRAGDRFQPIGMKSPKKLQDLFMDAKIPRERRHHLILATTLSGEIFWVEGLRISENFKITSGTKRQLFWGWSRNES